MKTFKGVRSGFRGLSGALQGVSWDSWRVLEVVTNVSGSFSGYRRSQRRFIVIPRGLRGIPRDIRGVQGVPGEFQRRFKDFQWAPEILWNFPRTLETL